MPDTQPGGVELKIRLFFGGHAQADTVRAGGDQSIIHVQFLGIIHYGHDIGKALIYQAYNALSVLQRFIPVVDDDGAFVDFALFVQPPDQINVEGRRGFKLSPVFKHLV